MNTQPKQNKHHRSRVAARHAGRRQKPGLHEHMQMMFPHHNESKESPAEEAHETPAQESAEDAGGMMYGG